MKRLSRKLPVLVLLFTAASLFAENRWSYTLGLTGNELAVSSGSADTYYLQQMVGVDLRGAALLETSGFYYGTFISASFPVLLEEINPYLETTEYLTPEHDFILFTGIPFGFRSSLNTGSTGFYTGFGPAMMMSVDLDEHLWISGMVTLEMGIEHTGRKGVGFGFGLRGSLGLASILVDTRKPDQPEYRAAPDPMVLSLVMGISWTAVRD